MDMKVSTIYTKKFCSLQKCFVHQELCATYGLLFFLGVKAGEDRVFGVFILLLDPEPAPDIDNAEMNNNIGR